MREEGAAPRTLDLFSGIGGFALAFEAAGFQTHAFAEIEPYPCKVLAQHWPEVPNLGDVRGINGEDFHGAIDVICGGFPCQDISTAGKGAGIHGERSGLWFEMLRIIRGARPAFCLLENVPALRSRGADVVLGGLEEAGYACRAFVVGAVNAGAPHRRQRVWIVAYSKQPRGHGIYEREQPGHMAANPGGGGSDGSRRTTAFDTRGGIQRKGTESGNALAPPQSKDGLREALADLKQFGKDFCDAGNCRAINGFSHHPECNILQDIIQALEASKMPAERSDAEPGEDNPAAMTMGHLADNLNSLPRKSPPVALPAHGGAQAAPPQAGSLDLEASEAKLEIASEELGRLCKARWAGPEEWAKVWHWEIPANEERDTDLKIGAAISIAQDLIKEVRRLRSPLVTPAPRPMKLKAKIAPYRAPNEKSCSVDFFRDGQFIMLVHGFNTEDAEEIAFRINSFEQERG